MRIVFYVVYSESEIEYRRKLRELGLKKGEKMTTLEDVTPTKGKRSHEVQIVEENRCEVSKKLCYLSMVSCELDIVD